MANSNTAVEGQVILTNVRLSFADIFRAKSVNEGEPRFSANFLLDKEGDKKQIEKVEAAIKSLVDSKNKGKKLPADKVCLRDGDEKDYDGFAGHMFISAANKKRPTVVDRDNSPLTEEDGKPYSGCYVDGVVRLWWQDNKFGKRINASLEVVRFRKDGESFGAAPVSASVLPDLDDEEDEV